MTLGCAPKIFARQVMLGSGYNRNAVRLLLGEIQRERGRNAVDGPNAEFDLERAFRLKPGDEFFAAWGAEKTA